MPTRVGPTETRPTHHIALRGGGYDIGLIMCDGQGTPTPFAMSRDRLQNTSIKISQGNPSYSDYELPFTPIPQEDWSGGMGLERYEDDTTRFLYGRNATSHLGGRLMLGPQMKMASGHTHKQFHIPGNTYWQELLPSGDRRYLAVKITPTKTTTLDTVLLRIKRYGSPGDLTVRLRDDNAGVPGTVTHTKTFTTSDIPDVLAQWQAWGSIGKAITSGTPFWVEVYGDDRDDDTNHWKIAVDSAPSASATKESADGTTWATSGVDLYWQIREADDNPDRAWFFNYKGAKYAILDWDDAAPKLFENGDRGVAQSNAADLTKLNDGSKSWATNEHVGKVVLIVDGPGSLEEQPWRVITANGASSLTVSPAWKIEHTTATEYVILDDDSFTEVSGSPLGSSSIYDIEIYNGVIYLARGDAATIRRVEGYNNAGTWTWRTYDDGSAKADLLAIVHHNDTTIGKTQMWRVVNDSVKASRADVPAWGVDFSFGTGIQVGDEYDKARRLVEYVDPVTLEKIPWIIKKGSVWAIKDDIPDMIPHKEMAAVLSENNGRAVLVHDLFLYYTLLKGLERYYDDIILDMGPNRERGLPEGKQGPIYHLIGYPGRFYACINAGDGYSAILNFNGDGWHPTYEADEAGQPIIAGGIQVIPGDDSPDRLWFLEGSTFRWLPLPSETVDPAHDPNYLFTDECAIETSRMHAGMMDVQKLFYSLKIMADNLESETAWIEVDYKVDDESEDWTPFPDVFDESPRQELAFVEPQNEHVTGKWLMLRVRLLTADANVSPVVRAWLINTISRIPTKFGYAVTVKFETQSKDLNGEPDDYANGLDKIADLDALAESLTVLTMDCVHEIFHGSRVFVDAPALQPYYNTETGEQGFIGTLPITEIVGEIEEEAA